LFIGSNTERLLRHTEVPVLAVPLTEGDILISADRLAAAVNVVLSPVDFSESSNQASRVAAGIAQALAAHLVLVHAVSPIHAIGGWREHAAALEQKTVAEAKQQIEALVRTFPIPAAIEVRVGTAVDVITTLGAEQKARLIVMGLRGAGGLLAPAPGSTAYRVLCLALIPVLALPTRRPDSAHREVPPVAERTGLP
jgi:nucleotide-binding universal stress UspA family protein